MSFTVRVTARALDDLQLRPAQRQTLGRPLSDVKFERHDYP